MKLADELGYLPDGFGDDQGIAAICRVPVPGTD
jgi:hypothetical protein